MGGRLGPRRTTSSREYTAAHGAPGLLGELARRVGSRATPPCRRTRRRWRAASRASPPGSHHDASGSRYAGSTQLVASRTPPGSTRAAAAAGPGRPWSAGPAPCPRARAPRAASPRPPSRRRRRANRGGRVRRPRDRDQRVARRPVVGEAAVAAGHVGADDLRGAAFQLGAPGGRGERTATVRAGRFAVDRLVHGLPAGAPAEVRGEGAVEIDAPRLAPRLVRPRGAPGSPGCRSRTASHRSRRSARPAGRGRRRRDRRR